MRPHFPGFCGGGDCCQSECERLGAAGTPIIATFSGLVFTACQVVPGGSRSFSGVINGAFTLTRFNPTEWIGVGNAVTVYNSAPESDCSDPYDTNDYGVSISVICNGDGFTASMSAPGFGGFVLFSGTSATMTGAAENTSTDAASGGACTLSWS